ncbi:MULTISPECIES: HAMP domain-containing sensor histidine kinase [unclassified Photobacterium]|uniref:sensor histidine kinase n=1 Tax=unclassified Photobacterium TaxID=2628852 RepID=UPI000D17DE44|nr:MULTISPECIES: HAMP domain-containing sensor histidine kinase [unclassified Photobacterium]PSV27434.1 two-component sensor histidine kinase [Photobacterium sp. GB-56]PSV34722.1 two-component sensor histidine kinase [Photobacterium sp. GB-210]PSV37107.1 two-component sensor histidine kinase [Photobacterium sp. GB-27]PSV44696.1 two-component sensor histidine kinase [Photobacterium sp. GB-36]PSV53668.1 two-component sensor histidine kinase [Photobacterium sp. GB-1]
MSYAGSDRLSRSSILKVLLYFICCVAIIFILFINQVYVNSETIYNKQLTKELNIEMTLFERMVQKGHINAIPDLVKEHQQIQNELEYRIINRPEMNTTLSYPAVLSDTELSVNHLQKTLNLPNNKMLIISVNPEIMRSYRENMTPMLVSGIVVPVILMLAGALLFAISILRKLERVNHGMNRVSLGEKGVKLPVSKNDDEFDVLTIHLNFLIEQVEKKEESLKELSVGMAHDLRTPIARMKLRLESLLEKDTTPFTKDLEACHDDLEVLLSMFNGMLEISHINTGKHKIDKQWVSLSQVCQDVVDFLLPISDEKKQVLSFREDEPYHVKGEPSLLFRAIYNVVENAIKYTPDEGSIDVVVDHFGVVVIDNGIGVSDEDKGRIKEPMYRADKSRTHQGFGLGLSLVEAVMKRHGGDLVFSDNNPGLRARLYFPLKHDHRINDH